MKLIDKILIVLACLTIAVLIFIGLNIAVSILQINKDLIEKRVAAEENYGDCKILLKACTDEVWNLKH